MTAPELLSQLDRETVQADFDGDNNFHCMLYFAARAAKAYGRQVSFLSRRFMACYITDPETGISTQHSL